MKMIITFQVWNSFSELRNLNVEHLGQVKKGIQEVDGTLSVIFYGFAKYVCMLVSQIQFLAVI